MTDNNHKSGELEELSICSVLEHMSGQSQDYKTKRNNLDDIILKNTDSVEYRVNSARATQLRESVLCC